MLSFQIDEDRAEGTSAPKGKVVDAEHPDRRCLRLWQYPEEPENRVARDADPKALCKGLGAASTSQEPKRLQQVLQAGGFASPRTNSSREAFGKDALWTRHVATAEFADLQPQDDLSANTGNVGNGTRVETVDMR